MLHRHGRTGTTPGRRCRRHQQRKNQQQIFRSESILSIRKDDETRRNMIQSCGRLLACHGRMLLAVLTSLVYLALFQSSSCSTDQQRIAYHLCSRTTVILYLHTEISTRFVRPCCLQLLEYHCTRKSTTRKNNPQQKMAAYKQTWPPTLPLH